MYVASHHSTVHSLSDLTLLTCLRPHSSTGSAQARSKSPPLNTNDSARGCFHTSVQCSQGRAYTATLLFVLPMVSFPLVRSIRARLSPSFFSAFLGAFFFWWVTIFCLSVVHAVAHRSYATLVLTLTTAAPFSAVHPSLGNPPNTPWPNSVETHKEGPKHASHAILDCIVGTRNINKHSF